jgi:signal transduction histidine kinase
MPNIKAQSPQATFRRAVLIAIAIVLVHRLLMLITADNQPVRININDTFFVVLSLGVAMGMFYVARNSEDTRNIRIAWSLFGLALLLAVLGAFIAVITDNPVIVTTSPSSADVFYLAFYVVFGAGLILMAGTNTVEDRLKMLLDIGIVMLAVFLVFWLVLIVPILKNYEPEPLTIAVAVAYPLGDGVLILAALWVLFGRQGNIQSTPLLLLTLAGIGQVVNDVIYLSQTIAQTYVPGGWFDTLPIFNFSVLIVVIAYQLTHQPPYTTNGKPQAKGATRQFEWTIFIPPAGILVAYILFYWASGNVYPMSQQMLAWIVGITIGLSLIREFLELRDNKQLTKKLQQELTERQAAEQAVRELNTELEQRVQDRTAALTKEVAERKQAQSDRERLITELKAKNVELEQFSYTVSHDLRAPLITIRGFLGLVEKDAVAGNIERVRGDMARIIAATEKMERLLTELLELSRIGRMMNPPQAVPFDEIAREAVELVRGRITERSIAIEIAPGLPVVYGDRTRLVQVMQNLIDNSTKFMGDQMKPRIEIGLAKYAEDGKPILFVRDNGIGISAQNQGKIFGLFNQISPGTEGTGVGLALVKRIIEVHGGEIWVESQGSGQGTTFSFSLPLAQST